MTSKAKKNGGTKINLDVAEVKLALMQQADCLQPLVQEAVQTVLGLAIFGKILTQ